MEVQREDGKGKRRLKRLLSLQLRTEEEQKKKYHEKVGSRRLRLTFQVIKSELLAGKPLV